MLLHLEENSLQNWQFWLPAIIYAGVTGQSAWNCLWQLNWDFGIGFGKPYVQFIGFITQE